jgi:hypothetical protein
MKVERTNILHDLVQDFDSSVGHDNKTQLVTHVLHFMNLDKSSHGVQIRQVLHNIRLVSINIINETPKITIEESLTLHFS